MDLKNFDIKNYLKYLRYLSIIRLISRGPSSLTISHICGNVSPYYINIKI